MESFYLCNSAALQADLSKSAFKIYSFLCMSANTKTRDSFYKRSNIAALCHTSESTVVRSVRELRSKGLLEVKRRFIGKGQQTSNLYILLDGPQLHMEPTAPKMDTKSDKQLVSTESEKKPQSHASAKLRVFKCNPASFAVKLSPNEMKVYSYLSFRAGKDGECKPAKRDIAYDCGISIPTVTRAIRKLEHTELLMVIPQTREEIYGNNGTSVNRYVINKDKSIDWTKSDKSKSHNLFLIKVLFSLLLTSLTPSLISPVTPHRTRFRLKVTLKQRKEYLFSKITKWYKAHNYSKLAWKRLIPAKHVDSHNSG